MAAHRLPRKKPGDPWRMPGDSELILGKFDVQMESLCIMSNEIKTRRGMDGQFFAGFECVQIDELNTGRHNDAGEISAIFKCAVADRCYTVRKMNACDVFTAAESFHANACNAFRNDNLFFFARYRSSILRRMKKPRSSFSLLQPAKAPSPMSVTLSGM